jgi:hypothetical protein
MLKAITLWVPWGWAILHAGKNVENRWSNLGHTGVIAVHSGLHWDYDEVRETFHDIKALHADVCRARETPTILPTTNLEALKAERGHITGIVTIREWKRARACPSPWVSSLDGDGWCAVLQNPVALPRPVACKGARGIWVVPPEVETLIYEQVKVA